VDYDFSGSKNFVNTQFARCTSTSATGLMKGPGGITSCGFTCPFKRSWIFRAMEIHEMLGTSRNKQLIPIMKILKACG
jgi:hypothetical protein